MIMQWQFTSAAAKKVTLLPTSSVPLPDNDSSASELDLEADEDLNPETDGKVRAVAWALAQSLTLLPEFCLPKKFKHCIDSVKVDYMRNVCI